MWGIRMDIEEDIKILENLKKYLNLLIYEGTHKIIYNDLGWDEKTIDCINAIDHILEEREEDKKRIEELEDRCKSHQKLLYEAAEVEKNGIPKQKVKEALEDIEDYFDRLNGPDEDMKYIRNKKKELLEEK